MSVSKSITAYEDIKLVLDSAKAAGGGLYEMKSEGEAIRWRARANMYRSLLRKQATLVPGHVPSTPYDSMTLRLNGNIVKIEFGEPAGVLRSLANAKPLPLVKQESDAQPDELELIAKNLLSEKGI